MASKVILSPEAVDAIRTLSPGTSLVIDGTVAEMSVGYTMSCRGIDPDQMGVHLESEVPQPIEDFDQPMPNVPLYVDKDILQNLVQRGKTLKIIFVPASDEKCRFLAIAK